MSLSSFCVVSNALRLNLFKLRDSSHDHPTRGKRNTNRAMKIEINQSALPETNACENEIRLRIEGMMCEHCEATVKKALESIAGVTSATVSHQEGIAVVRTNGNVSLEEMKQAVEVEDYKVLNGECSEC